MATIKIRNNEPRIHTIAHGYAELKAGQAGVRPLSFRLIPGVNEIDAGAWAQAKKLPVVAHHIAEGNFDELTGDNSGLDDLKPPAAIELVKETLDRELLKRWKAKEKRASVVAAIDEQVDAVTFKPDRDTGKDADEMDLKPRKASVGLTAEEVADQTQEVPTQAESPRAAKRGGKK